MAQFEVGDTFAVDTFRGPVWFVVTAVHDDGTVEARSVGDGGETTA
jgi:hypothetical protein